MTSPYRTIETAPPPNDYRAEAAVFRAQVAQARRRDLVRSVVVKAIYLVALTFSLTLFYAVVLHLLT